MPYERRYLPRRYLAQCCGFIVGGGCNPACGGGGGCGMQCGQGGGCQYGGPHTCMSVPPLAKCANSTSQGGNLPATGQPASGASGSASMSASSSSGFMSNLTNFQTPYPYLAIGGVILVAALLIPGGRKAGSSTPNVIHYG